MRSNFLQKKQIILPVKKYPLPVISLIVDVIEVTFLKLHNDCFGVSGKIKENNQTSLCSARVSHIQPARVSLETLFELLFMPES